MTWPSGTTTWRDANGEVYILMPDELDQAAMMVAFADQLRQQAWSGERLSAVAVELILTQAQSLDEMTALAVCRWRVASPGHNRQLGQLLGVRHKDADLGDSVGAVAAVNNQARCAVSVARWSPTHRSSSSTYGIS